MRRKLLISGLISLLAPFSLSPRGALAQETPSPAAEPAEEPAEAAEEPAEDPEEPEEAPPPPPPALEAPALSPLEVPPAPPPEPEGPALPEVAPPEPVIPPPVEKKRWTMPETVFQLHGYFRLRGNLLKDGNLGHSAAFDRLQFGTSGVGDNQVLIPRDNYDPFPFFTPQDSASLVTPGDQDDPQPPVAGGCGDNPGDDGRCDKRSQVSGDMRLRLKPEIHLSDDIRVKAWIDVLDNVGLGTLGYGPNDLVAEDVIHVRRVWGEARNRDIGELRFGRMGADWGLGILDNGGDRHGIDSDFSSDVDRIMGITNLAGFYLMAAYDWANQGAVLPGAATPSGVVIDRAQKDDFDAITLAVARRLDDELLASALSRGEKVFNYGVYFIYRNQFLQQNPNFGEDGQRLFTRLNQTQFIPDLWVQFLWEGLRVELEAAFVAGSLEGGCPRLITNPNAERGAVRDADEVISTVQGDATQGITRTSSGECKFRQLGLALETEYRLFDDRLGIYFNSGLATGDANAYGLAATNDPSYQRVGNADNVGNREISTYQFHPDYRVDLILWRTLMRRVAGAYYFKPGLSYDFIRDPYGQQAGARVDVIYSRASSPRQTWGNSGNLGLEIDVSLYYRSEDGPDVMDGFYALVQWGVLFPFQGLDYRDDIMNAPDTKNAMILRGVAGIAF